MTLLFARSLHLAWVGAFPWWAPIEPSWDRPSSLRAVASALFLLSVLAIGAWAARTRAWLAAFAWFSTAALVVFLAHRFEGAHGPLGRGAPFVTPLLWIAVVTTAQELFRARLPARLRPAQVGLLAGGAFGALSLLAAADRVLGRETQWRTALAHDPGRETAAIALSELLVAENRGGEATLVLQACARARPASCTCATRAALPDVDAARFASALALLDRSAKACGSDLRFVALRADALAQAGRYADASAEAERVLAVMPDDPRALYARGIAALAANDVARALSLGRRAEALGRGTPARLLVGGAQLLSGDLEGARRTFEAAAAADPTSAAARYHVGVAADRANQYNGAREAYLHALRLDPAFADARHALALLTARNGAKPEARHHLDKLRAIAPGDPRIASLEQMLAPP